LKDLILLFKYRHFGILGKNLARFAYEVLAEEEDLWWDVDAIIPVPLHPKRKKERGFNQARVIAKELARIKGVELVERCLVKIKNIVPQTSLEAEQRKKNVRGAFRVKGEERLKGKIVLLVDDVYTTGSTLKECSRVLRKAGVKEVRALTVAQA
jgi:ComF family protein